MCEFPPPRTANDAESDERNKYSAGNVFLRKSTWKPAWYFFKTLWSGLGL